MKLSLLLFVVALVAVVVAMLALAVAFYKNAKQPGRRLVVGNCNRQFHRRHLRKIRLAPLMIERLFYWAGFIRAPRGQVMFANIGEGTFEGGVKTYVADAATASRYLIYKVGTDADHSAVAGAGDVPIGQSNDQAEAGMPIGINLFGCKPGMLRVVTDGTIANGDYVKTGAAGQATKAANGDAGQFGKALFGTDTTSAAGDVITVVHVLPSKVAF
jgi:hypothetical protein